MSIRARLVLLTASLLCCTAAAASGAGGGAAPPERLSAQHQARVAEILAPYQSTTLTSEQAATILQALRDAQVPSGPALDRVLTAKGFSRKRLQALAPQAAASASGSAPVRVPRPQ